MRKVKDLLHEAYGGLKSIFANIMSEMEKFSGEAGAIAAESWGDGAERVDFGSNRTRIGEVYFTIFRESAKQSAVVRWRLNWEKKEIDGEVQYSAVGARWNRSFQLEWSESTPRGLGEHVAAMIKSGE